VAELRVMDPNSAALKEAHDLALEVSACLAGVVAVADLLDMESGVPDRVRTLLEGARDDLETGAEYLEKLRLVLERAVKSPAAVSS
jgi:hypothetical protein